MPLDNINSFINKVVQEAQLNFLIRESERTSTEDIETNNQAVNQLQEFDSKVSSMRETPQNIDISTEDEVDLILDKYLSPGQKSNSLNRKIFDKLQEAGRLELDYINAVHAFGSVGIKYKQWRGKKDAEIKGLATSLEPHQRYLEVASPKYLETANEAIKRAEDKIKEIEHKITDPKKAEQFSKLKDLYLESLRNNAKKIKDEFRYGSVDLNKYKTDEIKALEGEMSDSNLGNRLMKQVMDVALNEAWITETEEKQEETREKIEETVSKIKELEESDPEPPEEVLEDMEKIKARGEIIKKIENKLNKAFQDLVELRKKLDVSLGFPPGNYKSYVAVPRASIFSILAPELFGVQPIRDLGPRYDIDQKTNIINFVMKQNTMRRNSLSGGQYFTPLGGRLATMSDVNSNPLISAAFDVARDYGIDV